MSAPRGSASKRDALRALLADGRWHTQSELQAVGGYRYGARLLELRRSGFGVLTAQTHLIDNAFAYKHDPLAPPPPPVEDWKSRALRAEAELASLRRSLALAPQEEFELRRVS